MKSKKEIALQIENSMGFKIKRIKLLGKGASGKAYLIKSDALPCKVAVVKVSEHVDALKKEKQMLEFLYERCANKVPNVYFFFCVDGRAFLGMRYIKGISGKSWLVSFVPNKKHLRESILDTLDSIQGIKGNGFGKYDSPEYKSWKAYYYDFFIKIYAFTKSKHKSGEVSSDVMRAIDEIHLHFDEIYNSPENESCLCHGDFWMPNFIIDFAKSEINGVLDPFDMLWAEKEYELFALTVGAGNRLRLYEGYKKRHMLSRYCDLKIEVYALVNELHWFDVLGSIDMKYIEFRAGNVLKAIKNIKPDTE